MKDLLKHPVYSITSDWKMTFQYINDTDGKITVEDFKNNNIQTWMFTTNPFQEGYWIDIITSKGLFKQDPFETWTDTIGFNSATFLEKIINLQIG